MYKVFFNDRTIFLTDSFNQHFKAHNGLFQQYHNKTNLKFLINKFEKTESFDNLFIHFKDLNELQFIFKSCFSFMEAAGGVVRNSNGEILAIKRLGKWDLPKGKVEKGENFKEAAIREVEEECGISNVKITASLHPTYHTYWLNNNRILKETHWYEMTYEGNEPLVPQAEEGITEVRWIKPSEMEMVINDTYASIREVLHEYRMHNL